MLRGKVEREMFDLWFSYSGENEEIVNDIYESLKNWEYMRFEPTLTHRFESSLRKVEVVSPSSEECDAFVDFIQKVRISPRKYQWMREEKDGKVTHVTQLPPNGKIESLVFQIAESFLKVVVISRDYFKSPICMQELCMCLVSNHSRLGIFPMHLSLFENPAIVFTDETFEFGIPVSGKSGEEDGTLFNVPYELEPLTLAKALFKTHQYLREKYGGSLYGFDMSEKTVNFFRKKLDWLTTSIYVQSCKDPDPVESASRIYEFALHTVQGKLSNWKKQNRQHLKRLMHKPSLKKLNLLFADFSKKWSFVEDFFAESREVAELIEFMKSVEDCLDTLELDVKQAEVYRSYIGQLSALAILQCINAYSADLIPYYQRSNSLIPVNSTRTINGNSSNESTLLSYLAYAIAFDQILEINHDHFNQELNATSLVNASSRMENANDVESNTSGSYKLLKLLVNFYNPNTVKRLPRTFEEAKQDRVFIEEFYQDVYFAHKRNEVAVLVTHHNYSRNNMGNYKEVSDVLALLNSVGKEYLVFPLIEVKLSNNDDTKESSDTWFSPEEIKYLSRSLQNIFRKLSVTQPA